MPIPSLLGREVGWSSIPAERFKSFESIVSPVARLQLNGSTFDNSMFEECRNIHFENSDIQQYFFPINNSHTAFVFSSASCLLPPASRRLISFKMI